MRRVTRVLLPLMAAAVGLACSGSDPVEAPTTENFARAWTITKCEYRSTANDDAVELVGAGWTIMLWVNDNGMFLLSRTPPGGTEELIGGSWSASGRTVTFTPVGAAYSWQFSGRVKGETMTLAGAHAEYDLDDDGAPEDVVWNMAGHT